MYLADDDRLFRDVLVGTRKSRLHLGDPIHHFHAVRDLAEHSIAEHPRIGTAIVEEFVIDQRDLFYTYNNV